MPELSQGWVAVSHGALDLLSLQEPLSGGAGVLVLPTHPSPPLGLTGSPEALWRRLVAGPVHDRDLTHDERQLVRAFADVGTASRAADHPARVTQLDAPWFASPMHELVAALAVQVAREVGAQAVLIKGPVLWRQGLRTRQHSGDVDIWIDPSRIDDVVAALESWGWMRKRSMWDGSEFAHSVTLTPGAWGCEIDVHRHFPGIDLDAAPAFRALTEHAITSRMGSHDVVVPDRMAHAVIAALHVARPTRRTAGAVGRNARAAEILRAAGVDSVVQAEVLGATGALNPALRQAFPEARWHERPAPTNWTWLAHPNPVRGYLRALRRISGRERLGIVLRLIWPPSELTLHSDRLAGMESTTVARARLRRWRRGMKNLRRRS